MKIESNIYDCKYVDLFKLLYFVVELIINTLSLSSGLTVL